MASLEALLDEATRTRSQDLRRFSETHSSRADALVFMTIHGPGGGLSLGNAVPCTRNDLLMTGRGFEREGWSRFIVHVGTRSESQIVIAVCNQASVCSALVARPDCEA